MRKENELAAEIEVRFWLSSVVLACSALMVVSFAQKKHVAALEIERRKSHAYERQLLALKPRINVVCVCSPVLWYTFSVDEVVRSRASDDKSPLVVRDHAGWGNHGSFAPQAGAVRLPHLLSAWA